MPKLPDRPHAHPGMRHFIRAAAAPTGLADGPDAHPLAWAESCRPLARIEGLILTAAVQRTPEAAAAVLADCGPHAAALGLAHAAGRLALADACAAFGIEPPAAPNPEADDLRKQLAGREAEFMTERDKLAARVAELEAALKAAAPKGKG